jgi:hypothetical protein
MRSQRVNRREKPSSTTSRYEVPKMLLLVILVFVIFRVIESLRPSGQD